MTYYCPIVFLTYTYPRNDNMERLTQGTALWPVVWTLHVQTAEIDFTLFPYISSLSRSHAILTVSSSGIYYGHGNFAILAHIIFASYTSTES